MYVLYFAPGAASFVVHLTLLELGAAHELRKVDLAAGEQKSADYMKLNPHGLVPTLLVDGSPMLECAAMLLLLTERHPSARLAPPPGDPKRPLFLQWMFHFANTLQPAFRAWFYPHLYGPVDRPDEVKANADARVAATWDVLDRHLAKSGPFILGADCGVVDFFATMLMRWSRFQPKQAIEWPALAKLAACVKSRPAWQRVYQAEGLTEW